MLSTEKYSSFASYLTGWMGTVGNWTWVFHHQWCVAGSLIMASVSLPPLPLAEVSWSWQLLPSFMRITSLLLGKLALYTGGPYQSLYSAIFFSTSKHASSRYKFNCWQWSRHLDKLNNICLWWTGASVIMWVASTAIGEWHAYLS